MHSSLYPVAFVALVGVVSVMAIALSASAAEELPVAVAPDDAHVAFMGRWDTRDGAGPRCQWSASSVSLRFRGVAAGVTLKDSGGNYFQVIVDGKPGEVLHPGGGESTHTLAAGLPEADHTVELFRRTE